MGVKPADSWAGARGEVVFLVGVPTSPGPSDAVTSVPVTAPTYNGEIVPGCFYVFNSRPAVFRLGGRPVCLPTRQIVVWAAPVVDARASTGVSEHGSTPLGAGGVAGDNTIRLSTQSVVSTRGSRGLRGAIPDVVRAEDNRGPVSVSPVSVLDVRVTAIGGAGLVSDSVHFRPR